MAALSTNTLIDNIISVGPDASKNLFTVEITFSNEYKIPEARIEDFNAPGIETNVVKIPYQNIEFNYPVPSYNVDRRQTFTFRLDENYELYKNLRDYCLTDSVGNLYQYKEDPVYNFFNIEDLYKDLINSKIISHITVYTYKNSNFGELEVTSKYIFHNCLITKIPIINYTYSSSDPISIAVEFIYSDYEFS